MTDLEQFCSKIMSLFDWQICEIWSNLDAYQLQCFYVGSFISMHHIWSIRSFACVYCKMPIFRSSFTPSLIPALQNIGILHHKKAELCILLQQSVFRTYCWPFSSKLHHWGHTIFKKRYSGHENLHTYCVQHGDTACNELKSILKKYSYF